MEPTFKIPIVNILIHKHPGYTYTASNSCYDSLSFYYHQRINNRTSYFSKDVNYVLVFLPLSTLNTVTQKADQILVTDMANCFDFHPEFPLSLPSAHDKNSYYYKKAGKRVKACTAIASIRNRYRKSLQIVKDFLDSNWGAI